jgi:hypothetical protein
MQAKHIIKPKIDLKNEKIFTHFVGFMPAIVCTNSCKSSRPRKESDTTSFLVGLLERQL